MYCFPEKNPGLASEVTIFIKSLEDNYGIFPRHPDTLLKWGKTGGSHELILLRNEQPGR
jgi:hypothetical protein